MERGLKEGRKRGEDTSPFGTRDRMYLFREGTPPATALEPAGFGRLRSGDFRPEEELMAPPGALVAGGGERWGCQAWCRGRGFELRLLV